MLYIRQNEAPRMGQEWVELEPGKYSTVMKDRFQVEDQKETFEPGDSLIMERDADGYMNYTGSDAPVNEELIPAKSESNKAGKRGKKEKEEK